MLAASAYSLSNATTKAEIDRLLRKKWKFAAAQLVYYLGDALYGLVTDKKIDWGDLISAATVLFKPISFELLLFLEAKMAIEEAAETDRKSTPLNSSN